MSSVGRDDRRARKIRAYRRRKRAAAVSSAAVSVAILMPLAVQDSLPEFTTFVDGLPGPVGLQAATFFALLFVVVTLAQLPFSVYGEYVLEKRMGLSAQSAWSWALDQAKSVIVTLVLGAAAASVVYTLMELSPAWWWAMAAAGFIVVVAVLSNLAPVLLLPLFFKFEPLPEGQLKDRLAALAAKAGSPTIGIYVWRLSRKSSRSNAAVVGWGRTRRIVISDTMLDQYEPDEIETVIAHELGHHVHGDVRNTILFQAPVAGLAFFLLDALYRWIGNTLDVRPIVEPAGMPLLGLILMALSAAALPAVNAFSRWREAEADKFSLRLTRNASAFERAMEKLARQNLAERRPGRSTEVIFYSHPPVGRRIKMAREFETGQLV